MLKPIVIDFSSLENNGFSCYLKGRSYDLQENFQTLDIEKAVYYYKKGYYEYGDILCQYSIAASLNDEMFIPFFDDEDKKVSFPKYEELEELSKQNNYEGICATFACAFYLNYGIGVDKDEQLAYNLIKSCADRGHVGAMYDLGTVPKFIKNIGEDESQRYLELASLGGSMRAKKKYKVR